jgi:hypothetical protein
LPIERVQEFSFTGSSVLEDKWCTVSREASNKRPFYRPIFPEHINVFKNILKQVASFPPKE